MTLTICTYTVTAKKEAGLLFENMPQHAWWCMAENMSVSEFIHHCQIPCGVPFPFDEILNSFTAIRCANCSFSKDPKTFARFHSVLSAKVLRYGILVTLQISNSFIRAPWTARKTHLLMPRKLLSGFPIPTTDHGWQNIVYCNIRRICILDTFMHSWKYSSKKCYDVNFIRPRF